jgi:hypothetical protein
MTERTQTADGTVKSGWRFWLVVAILLPCALYHWVKDVMSGSPLDS